MNPTLERLIELYQQACDVKNYDRANLLRAAIAREVSPDQREVRPS